MKVNEKEAEVDPFDKKLEKQNLKPYEVYKVFSCKKMFEKKVNKKSCKKTWKKKRCIARMRCCLELITNTLINMPINSLLKTTATSLYKASLIRHQQRDNK